MTQSHVNEPYRSVGGVARRPPASSTSSALDEISRAADELRRRLEDVVAASKQPIATSRDDTELGTVFVRAQGFMTIRWRRRDSRLTGSWTRSRSAAENIIAQARKEADELLRKLVGTRQCRPKHCSSSRGRSRVSVRLTANSRNELHQLHSSLNPQLGVGLNGSAGTVETPAPSSKQYWTTPAPVDTTAIDTTTPVYNKGWDYKAG